VARERRVAFDGEASKLTARVARLSGRDEADDDGLGELAATFVGNLSRGILLRLRYRWQEFSANAPA